ncbi:uncharacterized protein F4822DRAFT_65432 [Hypoxylon trugodes]|uniref:uncharacterized protein n=1 Tax=Hypoxylon trugodes TaxID=326681 RepID=UPI0021A02BC8|nr:uncharacterized protein F4822DRAFT_65432 [Hypoxylon trugodes]KAI1384290.1 hypothetical protein F4822DRAFT_65432 [Hypoxylon trugodes]
MTKGKNTFNRDRGRGRRLPPGAVPGRLISLRPPPGRAPPASRTDDSLNPMLAIAFPHAGGSDNVGLRIDPPGQKRSRETADVGGRDRQQRRRMGPSQAMCGNCERLGHKARDCIRVGLTGCMDGACPKCNYRGHRYQDCRFRRKEEDIDYLFWYRQNKGPVLGMMNVGRLVSTAIATGDPRFAEDKQLARPYTPEFALEREQNEDWRTYRYQFPGSPDKEASERVFEPQFVGMTPAQLALSLGHVEQHDGGNVAPQGLFAPLAEPLPYGEASVKNEIPSDGPSEPIKPPVSGGTDSDKGKDVAGPSTEAEGTKISTSPVDEPAFSPASTANSQLPNFKVSERAPNLERLMTEAPDPELEAKPSTCWNCGRWGHQTNKCVEPCGACNSKDHVWSPACPEKDNACVCDPYPRHVRSECPELCQYCLYIGNTEKIHRCLDCKVICHFCLETNHTTRKCARFLGTPEEREVRKRCGACPGRKYHLSTFCPNKVCPIFGCDKPFDCKKHCKGCGMDVVNDWQLRVAGLPPHHCQWKKEWDFTCANPSGRRVYLYCENDAKHTPRRAEELQQLRKDAVEEAINTSGHEVESWTECSQCKE